VSPRRRVPNGGGKAYRIRSDDIDSLGAHAGNADVRATASLTDITNRRRPIVVADNLTLRLTADGTDPDAIGITLWAGNRLVLSSRWTAGARSSRRSRAGASTSARDWEGAPG